MFNELLDEKDLKYKEYSNISAVTEEQLQKILKPNGKYKLYSENKSIPHVKEPKKNDNVNSLDREF